MKVKQYICFTILLSLFFVSSVSAKMVNYTYKTSYSEYNGWNEESTLSYDDEYQFVCSYFYGYSDYVLLYDINEKNIYPKFPIDSYNGSAGNYTHEFDIAYLLEDWKDNNFKQKCREKLYLCNENVPTFGETKTKHTFVIDDAQKTALGKSIGNCHEVTEKFGDENSKIPCKTYEKARERIEDYYNNYKNCEEDDTACKQENYSSATAEISSLKDTCRTLLKNSSVGETQCVDSCLNMEEDIASLKKDLEIDSDSNKICGFSEKMVLWIASIIRWGKYIIPVAVIVLGILDFLKAVGANKEDEMKKAQGRFVKRLIAAALIFIAPLIIEFILDKLGFGSNGCGIINL